MNVYQAERIILTALRKAGREDQLVAFDTQRYHHRPFGNKDGFPSGLDIERRIYVNQTNNSYPGKSWDEAVARCLEGERL